MSKMFYIRVTEEELIELPKNISMRGTILDGSYYPENDVFMFYYKAYKKAKKAFEDYKFDLRHKS